MNNTNAQDSMQEPLAHEVLKERIRAGWCFDPSTPGLQKAAFEVMAPLVEAMRGREIIYRCRVPWLMRIKEVEVDENRFRATGIPVREIPESDFPYPFASPLKTGVPLRFGAQWSGLHFVYGSAFGMTMLPDHFYTDSAIVDAIKAALDRNAPPEEIVRILRPEAPR